MYTQNGYPVVTDPLPTVDPCGGTGAASSSKRASFGLLAMIVISWIAEAVK